MNRQPDGGRPPKPKPARKPPARPSAAAKSRAARNAAAARQERTRVIALAAVILIAIGFVSIYLLAGRRPPVRQSPPAPASSTVQGNGTAFGSNLSAPGAGQGSTAEYGPHGQAGFEASPGAGAPAGPSDEPGDDE